MAVIEAFGPGRIGIKRIDFLQVDHVIQLGREPNRIDILTGISGVRFDEAWDNREQGKIADAPYLSLADLPGEEVCLFTHPWWRKKHLLNGPASGFFISSLINSNT
jgi:hypothetical protein